MSYSNPTSFYDILPNDYLHMTYTDQVDNNVDRGFGESCHFPPTGGELPSFYPTYNGLPPFQTPASLPSTFSSSVASSTSGGSTWGQSPNTLSDGLSSQPILEPETEERKVKPAATQPGKRKQRTDSQRRVGGHIERPPGTGYAAMFKQLSADVQQDIIKRYDCCEKIDKKDHSTLLKHWVSTGHFERAVGHERLGLQPTYTCPAFLSMHGLCKNAKPGRYDSASRHCKSCAGFQQIRAESGIKVTPVQLTRGEYEAVQDFRKKARPGQGAYSEPILNAVFKVLMMMATSKTGPRSSTEIPGSESSDEHAGVLIPDEVLRLFTPNKSEDDGEDDVDNMFQF